MTLICLFLFVSVSSGTDLSGGGVVSQENSRKRCVVFQGVINLVVSNCYSFELIWFCYCVKEIELVLEDGESVFWCKELILFILLQIFIVNFLAVSLVMGNGMIEAFIFMGVLLLHAENIEW